VAGFPLVTGATGFAGSHLLDALTRGGARVAAWAHTGGRTPPVEGSADAPVRWRAVDLLDRADVRRALETVRPSVIYHCAGIADVQAAWRAPALALRVNVVGTDNLL
jgi:nucleoside-diphosphate-sugar epimerase